MGGSIGRFRGMGLSAWLALATGMAAPVRADESPTFERDIKPLFAKRCTVCHDPKKLDDPDVSGGLALDTYEAALKGTKDRKVIVPGKAAGSELIRRLSATDEDERMPLYEKPLPEPQRELIRRWIDAGVPRGVATASPSLAGPAEGRPKRRIVRSLDVVLPTQATIPAGTEGMGPGGAVQVVLKIGPLPAVSALAFRGDGRQLAVGTHGEVIVWDLPDARPAVILHDIPGPVHALLIQPGRQAARGRRGAAGAVGNGPGLRGPRRDAPPRFRGARRRRRRRRLPARRRPARLGLVRPDGPALGPRRAAAPRASSRGTPTSSTTSPTRPTAGLC